MPTVESNPLQNEKASISGKKPGNPESNELINFDLNHFL